MTSAGCFHRRELDRYGTITRARRDRDMKTKTKIKAGGFNVSGL